jgi:hypothetical protein
MGHYDDYYEQIEINTKKTRQRKIVKICSEYKQTFDDMTLFFRDFGDIISKDELNAITNAWETFQDKINRVKINNGVLITDPNIIINELKKGK